MRNPYQQSWVPGWAREAIFYHIYPLGFLGAPPQNDPEGEPVPRLADLRKWYDHIAGLGVNAIYFGPLFESVRHGYDTTDYFQIDRRLGDVALFRQIVGELHERGIRVILDGVFNHTGREFFAFRDIREHGQDSRYAGWYHVDWSGESSYQDGFAYECWEGHQSLPRLNLDNPDVRQYIFEVCRMWLGDVGVDGWRLDVAYEISPDFWWEFRRECKRINPDCLLLGEMIYGDYRTWVAPDLLDSGTDYQLYKAFWSSLNDANLWELKYALERAYHSEVGVFGELTLLNFLGNHDVTRILSKLEDPRHIYVALIMLFTVPGIPCLYYGDEIGLTGRKEEGDQALRRPMLPPDAEWPEQSGHLYREMARMVALRKRLPVLSYGRFAALEVTDTQFSFLRMKDNQVAVVALNAGDEEVAMAIPVGREGVGDGTRFRDALEPDAQTFTVTDGKIEIEPLWPYWGRVLVSES
jgi:cyclomaltodextrinase